MILLCSAAPGAPPELFGGSRAYVEDVTDDELDQHYSCSACSSGLLPFIMESSRQGSSCSCSEDDCAKQADIAATTDHPTSPAGKKSSGQKVWVAEPTVRPVAHEPPLSLPFVGGKAAAPPVAAPTDLRMLRGSTTAAMSLQPPVARPLAVAGGVPPPPSGLAPPAVRGGGGYAATQPQPTASAQVDQQQQQLMLRLADSYQSVCQSLKAQRASLRPIRARDFREALKVVVPSVDKEGLIMHELREFNARYGDNPKARAAREQLTYFL